MNVDELKTNLVLKEGVPPGKDPDKYSKILKEYHKTLLSNRNYKNISFNLLDGDQNILIGYFNVEKLLLPQIQLLLSLIIVEENITPLLRKILLIKNAPKILEL